MVTVSISYLHQLHHWDRVKEVKATKPIQSVGGAGNICDGQRWRVAGKDGVSSTGETDLTRWATTIDLFADRRAKNVLTAQDQHCHNHLWSNTLGTRKAEPLLLWRSLIESTEQILFDLQVFYYGLQHQVSAVRCSGGISGRGHVLQGLLDEFLACLQQAGQKPPVNASRSIRSRELPALIGQKVQLFHTSGLSANFFLTTLLRLPSIPLMDFLRRSSLVSTSVTVWPVAAATCGATLVTGSRWHSTGHCAIKHNWKK